MEYLSEQFLKFYKIVHWNACAVRPLTETAAYKPCAYEKALKNFPGLIGSFMVGAKRLELLTYAL